MRKVTTNKAKAGYESSLRFTMTIPPIIESCYSTIVQHQNEFTLKEK